MKNKNISRIIKLAIIFTVTLLADLLSKYFVCKYTIEGNDIVVIPKVLTFTYSENTGASFGMFGESTVGLIIFTSIVIVAMAVYLFATKKGHPLMQTSLVLILSGAIGNLYDRIAFRYVRDFIDYTIIETIFKVPFAVCNFADLVLIVGTVMMCVYILFYYDKHYKSLHPQVAVAGSSQDAKSIEVTTDNEIIDTVNENNDNKDENTSVCNQENTNATDNNISEETTFLDTKDKV